LLQDLAASGAADDLSGGEFAIPKYFVFATTVASVDVFGLLTSLVRLALLPIPRIDGLIDKPVDVTYTLWSKGYESGLFDGQAGQSILFDSYVSGSLGSLHPTLFGEFYLAGGIAAVVISSLVAGVVLTGIDRFFRRCRPFTSLLLIGPVLAGFLMVGRGNSVIGFGYFFYIGIIAFIVVTGPPILWQLAMRIAWASMPPPGRSHSAGRGDQ
jgi:hypothetical protein